MKSVFEILEHVLQSSEFVNCNNFIEDGILDSFELMKLISCFEEEFQIEIDVDEINEDNFKNIESMEVFIQRLKTKIE